MYNNLEEIRRCESVSKPDPLYTHCIEYIMIIQDLTLLINKYQHRAVFSPAWIKPI